MARVIIGIGFAAACRHRARPMGELKAKRVYVHGRETLVQKPDLAMKISLSKKMPPIHQ